MEHTNDFEGFATKMRLYRQRKNESITQVGQAVGIDRTHLSKLENGHERPSKQVLLRLIRHYSLSISEASELWNLAGYPTGLVAFEEEITEKEVRNNMDNKQQQNISGETGMKITVPENSSVLYADAVFVTRTKYGIVFDFAQGVVTTNEKRVVSRIGMSVEHAQDLVNAIQQNINQVKQDLGEKKGKKVN